MIIEDSRRLPKTFEEDPKMFRSYTKELKRKFDINEIIDSMIITVEDMHVKYATRVPDVVSYEFYERLGNFPVKHSCLYNTRVQYS